MDRNDSKTRPSVSQTVSLSARRAWIEIYDFSKIAKKKYVALRKESVDRNVVGDVMGKGLAGRSPQGERG